MGFVSADQYRRVDAALPDAPTPAPVADGPYVNVVPGYECPLNGYILTAEVIAAHYCERKCCTLHVRREMVDGCRGVA